ncbi:MAG: RluA family pseudouridine synthase [Pyrinomonadaceae bacterium]
MPASDKSLPETNSADEPGPLTFRVKEEDAGQRLDLYLAAHIEGWSRARLQRAVADGEVLLGGRIEKPSYKLKTGDEIEADLVTAARSSFAPENIPVEAIYEDDDLIVINKPAGMVVHPAAGIQSGTLANALAYHFQDLSSSGGTIRPGIIHRLDKDTSGLLVVAKTEVAHENLADQFRDREIFKSYIALVHGSLARDSGSIDEPIARDPRHRTRMAVVRGGRPSISHYKVRRRYERFTLLDVEIKTGRTHQIRVHLAWINHPVVSDPVYGGGRDKTVADAQLRARISRLERQFLHAEQLGFRHPRTGAEMKFTVALPDNLQQFLADL